MKIKLFFYIFLIVIISTSNKTALIYADTISKLEKININQLNINAKEINQIKYPFHYDGFPYKIIFKNNNIVGLITGNDDTIWIGNKKILYFKIQPTKVINPIKGKDFFIIIGEKGKTLYVNSKTNEYKALPGKFCALEDIDNDGLPEVITLEESIARAYKIINSDSNPTLGLFVKSIQAFEKYYSDYRFYPSSFYVELPQITFNSKNNLIIVETPIKKKFRNENDSKKFANMYFEKWNQTKTVIKQTIIYQENLSHLKGIVDTKDALQNFTKIDKMQMYNAGLNPNRDSLSNEYLYYVLRYRTSSSKKDFPYLYQLKAPYFNKIFISEYGKGYTKLSNGTIAIFDWKGLDYWKTLIDIKKLWNNEIVFLSSAKKYLIMYNITTNQARMEFWKDILNYQPTAIKYFDGENLVVYHKKKIGYKDNKKIFIYKVTYTKAKVVKETW